eukprot:s1996_g3.t1
MIAWLSPVKPLQQKSDIHAILASIDRKTVLVNFLKPPSFESPLGGLRPQTMNPKGGPTEAAQDQDFWHQQYLTFPSPASAAWLGSRSVPPRHAAALKVVQWLHLHTFCGLGYIDGMPASGSHFAEAWCRTMTSSSESEGLAEDLLLWLQRVGADR